MNIDLIINATRRAAIPLMRDYNEIEHLKHSVSGVNNFVARSKNRTQEILLSELIRYFPEHELINISQLQEYPKSDNYIVFDPLEGDSNMQNMLPFFAITVFVSTKKKNITTCAAVINFPCLDKICYAMTGEGVLIETYKDSIKRKGRVSTTNALIAAKFLDFKALKFIEKNNLDLNALRILGSSAYAITQIVEGKAQRYLVDKLDWFTGKIADLMILQSDGVKLEDEDFNVYTTNKINAKKLLSFAR
jgi:fructose-1,6-bisphosphatase/inositol monophosphatase family enzyme